MEMNFSNVDLKQEASSREKVYFFVILALIVFMFARVVWLPKAQSTKLTKTKIQATKVQVDTLKKFMDEKLKEKPVQQVVQEVPAAGVGEQLERLLEKNKSGAIVASNLVDVLTTPKSIKGLRIISMNFGTEVMKDGFYILPMELEIGGQFRAFNKYIGQLEYFPYILTINNININAGTSSKSEVLAKLSLNLYIVGKPTGAARLQIEQNQSAGKPAQGAPAGAAAPKEK